MSSVMWFIMTDYESGTEEGYVTFDKFKMHYLKWGKSGKDIVALHSMMMDAHSFDFLAQSLSGSNRVLAIDLLGHGDSEKPVDKISIEKHTDIIRDISESLGFRNLVLLGHSVGGYISMIYAAKYPIEVSRVILVDIAPRDPAVKRVIREVPPSFRSKDNLLSYIKETYPYFPSESIDNRLKHAFRTHPDGQFTWKTDLRSAEMVRDSFVNHDFWPYIKQIRAPTLLIKGARSEVISNSILNLMKEVMSNFSVVELKNAGHQVPLDSPKEFEDAVERFIT